MFFLQKKLNFYRIDYKTVPNDKTPSFSLKTQNHLIINGWFSISIKNLTYCIVAGNRV